MMRRLLFFWIASLLCVMQAEAKEQKPTGDALLLLHEKSHNFGDVERRGGDLVYEFTFKNGGTTPLVLTRVVTSCSCLKGHFQRKPVPAGGEGVIRIVYEPQKSEPGVFNKVIQIYSNSREGREVITVQGNALDHPKVKVKNEKIKIK